MGFENKIGLDQDSNDGELTGINFVNFCTRSNQFEICENKLTWTNGQVKFEYVVGHIKWDATYHMLHIICCISYAAYQIIVK